MLPCCFSLANAFDHGVLTNSTAALKGHDTPGEIHAGLGGGFTNLGRNSQSSALGNNSTGDNVIADSTGAGTWGGLKAVQGDTFAALRVDRADREVISRVTFNSGNETFDLITNGGTASLRST